MTTIPLEHSDDEAEDLPAIGYTLADQYRANAELVKAAVDTHGLDHVAAVNLLGLTFNAHYTKIQLGLTAPVEA